MASPKDHSLSDEVLRFLANAKTGTQSLSNLLNCSMCMQHSPFLVLMIVNIRTLVDTIADTVQLFSTKRIHAEASRWAQYGIDNVEEFVSMYSPLLLPIISATGTIISTISQVCQTQTLQLQLNSLLQADKRLDKLRSELQMLV